MHHLIYLTGDMRRIAHRLRSGVRRAVSRVSRPGDRRRRRTVTPVSCHVLGRVMHPHFNRIFLGLMSSGRRSNRTADVILQVWRCHCSPEHRVSTKCFLFTSCRGAIYLCSSYDITTPAALLPNCNSCTPPALRGRSPFRRSLEGGPLCAPSWGTLRTPLPGPSTTPTCIVRRPGTRLRPGRQRRTRTEAEQPTLSTFATTSAPHVPPSPFRSCPCPPPPQ